MVNYLEIHFRFDTSMEEASDILAAYLSDLPFESFDFQDDIKGYIPSNLFNDKELEACLATLPQGLRVSWSLTEVEKKNWNEEWEKNYYDPITIGGKIHIRSSFHARNVKAQHEIVIDPKMSFGTGHHQTTSLMCELILSLDMKGKKVLDMGTGTGILGIIASKMGASNILGIEIDDWVCENAIENVDVNEVENMNIKFGDASHLEFLTDEFDLVIANIHREVIINDLPQYVQALKETGQILLSGFFKEDVPLVQSKLNALELSHLDILEKDNWVALKAWK